MMDWLQESVLVLINLATSVISGIAGTGGGMILVGLMPLFLPAFAIVPVHGATQLASNVSRAWFGRKDMDYRYFYPYAVGAVLGAVTFGILVRFISLDWVPVLIATYILLTQWSKKINHWLKNRENFYVIGFIQTGIGMFVGSPGPLHMPLLIKKYDDIHQAVTIGSLMVSFFHALKILVYVGLGFSFGDYWFLIVLMTISAILGSYLGTRLRKAVPANLIRQAVPWIMIIIACKIIIATAIKQGWANWLL